MRFESIAIANYRQYLELNIDFPATHETDLHILVASNGIGKTNLLNAINWCLYGDEPHLGNKEDSLSICNLSALESSRNSGEAFTNVSVCITAKAKESTLHIKRSVPVNSATGFSGHDIFTIREIKKSGETEIYEDEAANEIVSRLLPQKIRQYFFFDGEQLYNYFGKGRDTTHVKDSIHEIAQVNVVTDAKKHLDILIGEYQRQVGQLNPQIERLSAEKNSLLADKVQFEDKINELSAAISESEAVIAEMNQLIAGTESVVDDNEQYETNSTRLSEIEAEKKLKKQELRELIRKYYVLIAMYAANKRTDSYIVEKHQSGLLPPSIDSALIRRSLETHKCELCCSNLTTLSETHLLELLEKFKVSSIVSNKLKQIKNDVPRFVAKTPDYRAKLQTIFDALRSLEDETSKLESINKELIQRIRSCSSVEEIATWIEQRDINRRLIEENTRKQGNYEERIRQITNDINVKEREIESALSQEQQCAEIKKELVFAQEARGILNQIEQEITDDVRSKMELETMVQFANLIWKKNTYGKIELTQNYQLKLYHKITGESCLGSCSAAERELLALAFTIALHKVSGHDGLLFIDTPVGRVSDINRENFARSLIEVSKYKQLIMAFTPSEFSEEISKYFNDIVVSSKNILVSRDEETTRQEG